ncbi:MAG: hypothetical protein Q7T03_03135, partial [Deltaproteobacteria bacterium]|nr:hypothetical protein [Deltaproteobacteria bacterium]
MSSENGVKKTIPYSSKSEAWAEEFRRSFAPDAGMVDIDFPGCGVRDVWEMPLETVVEEAQKIFDEPDCDEARQDCVTVNYLDPLRPEPPRILRQIIPSVFQKSEKVRHLAEGIRHLLASYRAVECAPAYVLNDVGIDILLHQGMYIDGAVAELQSAGAMNAIYGQIKMFTNKLDACSKGQDTCLTQEEVLSALNNLMLGYIYCFQQAYQEWEGGAPAVVNPPPSPPVKQSTEPATEVTPQELPRLHKKKFPHYVAPQKKEEKPVEEAKTREKNLPKPVPDDFKRKENPVVQKRKGMENLAKVTGGIIQYPLPG